MFRIPFCLGIILEVILKKRMKNLITKRDPAVFGSPRRELSKGGLESVVTLLVCWQIVFLSSQTLKLNPAVWCPVALPRVEGYGGGGCMGPDGTLFLFEGIANTSTDET